MGRRFVVPPGWPVPPAGWLPPQDWRPDPAWGSAPDGWQFWVDDPGPGQRQPLTAGGRSAVGKVPVFGARSKVRELAEELASLRAEMGRLGMLDVLELQRRRDDLVGQVAAFERRLADQMVAQESALAEQAVRAAAEQEKSLLAARNEYGQVQARLRDLKAQVVVSEEAAILQEVGVYSYRHPLTDAAAYQVELARISGQMRAMARRDGGAIEASTAWMVNDSAAQGRKMVGDFSKLMLRAYNAEADNLIRTLKPYKLDAAISRLERVVTTIERLGRTMSIRIAVGYHRLRVTELELTADFLERVARDEDLEREEKARLREERRAQQELAGERQRLEKERQHYANALATVQASGDAAGAERLRGQLADVDRAIDEVDYRVANVRAGYVYVISNVGSFGADVVKIGMTRRLEPRDRIRELSDASVPFNFDVHALFFSADAVGIETTMHRRFANHRLNLVNRRREFFRVTPAQVRDELLEVTDGALLEFSEHPEAVEYRQSQEDRPPAEHRSPPNDWPPRITRAAGAAVEA